MIISLFSDKLEIFEVVIGSILRIYASALHSAEANSLVVTQKVSFVDLCIH